MAAGALTAGNAIGLVVQGQLIDRHGQPPVLVPAGITCGTAVILLAFLTTSNGPTVGVDVLAFIGGASTPATVTCMRVLWPSLLSDRNLRTTAYALLAVMFTTAVVIGPLLVSALFVLAGPMAPVLVAAGLATAGAVLFASTPASRRWRVSTVARGWRPRGLGTAGMRTLIAGNLGLGVVFGLTNVGVPAAAIAQHAPALSGVLFALAALGDGAGSLLYGAVSWPVPLRWRLALFEAASAIVIAGLGVARSPLALAPLRLAGGMLSAPLGITTSALLDAVAPEGGLTEAYTLMVAAGLIGSSIGYALGGVVVHAAGASVVFLSAACGMGCVLTWTLLRRGTLR